MSDPGFARPDLCSIRTAGGQEELAVAVRGGFSADGCPPGVDDPPAHRATGIDRAIRLSTAAAVLAVAGIAAYVSYWHAYAVVRAHGETGITARLEPATIDGLVYASSMVVLHAARHRVPVPSLARWLLGLGIAATLTANMAQGWSHGPVGAVVAAWPAVSLVGSSAPPGRHTAGRRQSTFALVRPAVPRGVLSRRQPLTATAPEGTSAARQARRGRPRVRLQDSRPSPPADSVTMRRLRPALAMTQRWPRTGSACRPATRFRNVGSSGCSDAHPAAGHEPESPMHDRHRRSQTHRVPRSRLTRKQGPPAVCRSLCTSRRQRGWERPVPIRQPAHPGVGLCHRPVAVAVGQRLHELTAGGDVELGEDLSQVVLNSVRAEEQPGGDLRVGQA
jgi:hypothetical protein